MLTDIHKIARYHSSDPNIVLTSASRFQDWRLSSNITPNVHDAADARQSSCIPHTQRRTGQTMYHSIQGLDLQDSPPRGQALEVSPR